MRKISLRNDAAELLREQKENGETLSDAVERLAGGDTDDESGVARLSSDREERAEQLAAGVLTGSDIMQINKEGMTRREYLAEQYGIDPAEYDAEDELLADLRAQKQ